MAATEFVPNQAKTEGITAHVIWLTTGLSCEGDSVAMTGATNPSFEDIITGAIPGMPRVVVHPTVLAVESSEEFMHAWYDAEDGKPDPFVLALEGSLPNENINGDGYWTGIGVNPSTGQPIGIDPRDAHFITSRICGICGDNPCTCSCLNQNMVYGVKPPPLGDYAFNLAESADFMFDHAIYNDCMANVDYSEQLVKETNPGPLKRAEETSAPHVDIHGHNTIADIMRALNAFTGSFYPTP